MGAGAFGAAAVVVGGQRKQSQHEPPHKSSEELSRLRLCEELTDFQWEVFPWYRCVDMSAIEQAMREN